MSSMTTFELGEFPYCVQEPFVHHSTFLREIERSILINIPLGLDCHAIASLDSVSCRTDIIDLIRILRSILPNVETSIIHAPMDTFASKRVSVVLLPMPPLFFVHIPSQVSALRKLCLQIETPALTDIAQASNNLIWNPYPLLSETLKMLREQKENDGNNLMPWEDIGEVCFDGCEMKIAEGLNVCDFDDYMDDVEEMEDLIAPVLYLPYFPSPSPVRNYSYQQNEPDYELTEIACHGIAKFSNDDKEIAFEWQSPELSTAEEHHPEERSASFSASSISEINQGDTSKDSKHDMSPVMVAEPDFSAKRGVDAFMNLRQAQGRQSAFFSKVSQPQPTKELPPVYEKFSSAYSLDNLPQLHSLSKHTYIVGARVIQNPKLLELLEALNIDVIERDYGDTANEVVGLPQDFDFIIDEKTCVIYCSAIFLFQKISRCIDGVFDYGGLYATLLKLSLKFSNIHLIVDLSSQSSNHIVQNLSPQMVQSITEWYLVTQSMLQRVGVDVRILWSQS
ncbi:hypothetical protein BCR33DRAFT_518331 [Rhizoclosmatium globosum]|uniref:Uncharacterized protein n=1 Tax=Rhizoclosmatium globosum TaxID=329046 RepID=A0A1Y2BFF4_9FUNG|nr:hypothetical protein BCR33DRAFT_518331 [Rhizoclosmatium globosum]|eukprot:ORY33533.1 hypothetical protein BCR33DRAFT_518331 [Rhizoclosmatium globosum]